MITYITVADVDSILGSDWTPDSNKTKSVLMANAWLNAKRLRGIDTANIPEEVKTAGAYVASVAAAGNLYEQKESTGILAGESVKADSVEVSETYYTGSSYINTDKLLDPDLQLALDLLAPYRTNPFQFDVRRG